MGEQQARDFHIVLLVEQGFNHRLLHDPLDDLRLAVYQDGPGLVLEAIEEDILFDCCLMQGLVPKLTANLAPSLSYVHVCC